MAVMHAGTGGVLKPGHADRGAVTPPQGCVGVTAPGSGEGGSLLQHAWQPQPLQAPAPVARAGSGYFTLPPWRNFNKYWVFSRGLETQRMLCHANKYTYRVHEYSVSGVIGAVSQSLLIYYMPSPRIRPNKKAISLSNSCEMFSLPCNKCWVTDAG